MKRKFTYATGFFMLGAMLSTYQCVGMYVKGGWASYMWAFLALCITLWWLVWLSTEKED